jgi:hypothetical protein
MHGTAATIIHGGPATRPLSARSLSRLLVTVETRQAGGSSVIGYKSDFGYGYSSLLSRRRIMCQE